LDTPTTFTENGDAIAVTMHLDEPSELFTAADFDPFQAQTRATAGIDDLVAYLSARGLRHKPAIKTTILLPTALITPGTAAAVRSALDCYCDYQEGQMRQSKAANRFEGLAKLPIGIVASIAAVILGFGFLRLLPLDLKDLSFVVMPIVTVVVWVAIWNPVEILLFDGWSDRRNLQIYRAIRAMEIALESA
jgi:hypothetical protein